MNDQPAGFASGMEPGRQTLGERLRMFATRSPRSTIFASSPRPAA